jgi:hypothetical protein
MTTRVGASAGWRWAQSFSPMFGAKSAGSGICYPHVTHANCQMPSVLKPVRIAPGSVCGNSTAEEFFPFRMRTTIAE